MPILTRCSKCSCLHQNVLLYMRAILQCLGSVMHHAVKQLKLQSAAVLALIQRSIDAQVHCPRPPLLL